MAKNNCTTIAVLTFIGILLCGGGVVMTAYGFKQAGEDSVSKKDESIPLNTLTIFGYAMSTVGGMMFLICGILWILCSAKRR